MRIPCAKCGSLNTVNENEPAILKILDKLNPVPKRRHRPGKYLVRCKDCGSKRLIMVN